MSNVLTGQTGGFGGTGLSQLTGAFNSSFAPQQQSYGPDQTQIAQIQAGASEYPSMLRNQQFQQLFPLVSGAFGKLGNGSTTPTDQGPAITAGPVWNPQQIQQQVNSSRAQTDASTQTQQKATADQAAGRGFSSSSPLTQALQGQEAGQGMATNANNENQIRWNSAQGNAGQLLNSQNARQAQFAAGQAQQTSRQNALLAALGGLI